MTSVEVLSDKVPGCDGHHPRGGCLRCFLLPVLQKAMEEFEKNQAPPPMDEEKFLGIYATVVSKAKEILLAVTRSGSQEGWKPGGKWEELLSMSRSTYMFRARKALLIDDEAFLKIVRNWPYSKEGEETMFSLFGGK